MTDRKITPPPLSDMLQKGYVPTNAPPEFLGGYQGPTAQQATPPAGGSSVQPPPAKDK